MDTNELLKERGKTHGLYSEHAAVTQATKDVWRSHRGWEKLTPTMRETLDMIAHKVGRVLAGDPTFSDHYVDICGYSQLIVQELTGGPDNA